MAEDKTSPDDLLRRAKDDFTRCEDAERENRETFEADVRFGLLDEQWPEKFRALRENAGRPVLTINKMKAYIKQVVNDARQNKPSMQVRAADSKADPETAQVFGGLIRNIEYASRADTAYDTAVENAVAGGWGYLRIVTEAAIDDVEKKDIRIKRVANPLSIYGDPDSLEADSSDWNVAFVTEYISEEQFKRLYGDKAKVDWDAAWTQCEGAWKSDEDKRILIAEWWTREEYEKPVVLLSDGTVVDADLLDAERKADEAGEVSDEATAKILFKLSVGAVTIDRESSTKCYRVYQRTMTGAEILEEVEWPGQYIPIVPVYGDEVNLRGKRYFRSLIHSAKGAQQMFNFARSNAAELSGLEPKVPYIGKKGSFATDAHRWQTANRESHAYLEYDGDTPPQRQPLSTGAVTTAMQESLAASDDIKSTLGMFDASLGQRSNETSGRAIMARQREGDVATFHFIDNVARAIRHAGHILIDIIPKVYSGERMVRILGEEEEEGQAQLGPQPVPNPNAQPDGPQLAVYSLTAGKYDLTVKSGPSFTTRREEAVAAMTELVRAYPALAPVIGPDIAKQMDWPGADKLAQKLEAMTSGQVPPQAQEQMQQMQKQLQDMGAQMQKLAEENQQLKQDQSDKFAEIASKEAIAKYEADSQERVANYKADRDAQAKFFSSQAQIAAAAARPQPQQRPLGQ